MTSDKASSRNQSEQSARKCDVCSDADVDDMRHVSVECFYDVNEVAPDAVQGVIFREVDDVSAFWGTTRRYPEGSIDRLRAVPRKPDAVSSATVHFVSHSEATPPIRLLELRNYSVSCCKSCRGDFLRLFGNWARGQLKTHSEQDEEHCIPVRENGALVWLTHEQFEARQQSRGQKP